MSGALLLGYGMSLTDIALDEHLGGEVTPASAYDLLHRHNRRRLAFTFMSRTPTARRNFG